MAQAFTQRRTKPRGPGGTEGPAQPGSQPGILLKSSSSPKLQLAQQGANFTSLTYLDAFCTSAQLDLEQRTQNADTR